MAWVPENGSVTTPEERGPRRLSPWVVAIVAGLLVVAVTNAVFIYVAVTGADPVVPSYVTEQR